MAARKINGGCQTAVGNKYNSTRYVQNRSVICDFAFIMKDMHWMAVIEFGEEYTYRIS
jgi:hypothetical protein